MPKLDKMLSLVQQVVQSADHLSTYIDKKKTTEEDFASQLYFNDRQNLLKFVEKGNYGVISNKIIELNSALGVNFY